MRASGMAHHEQARRIAAEIMRVIACPSNGGCGVIDKTRKSRFRILPIIGQHGHVTARGQRLRHEKIIAAAAVLPASTVEKHDNSALLARNGGLRGNVDIE